MTTATPSKIFNNEIAPGVLALQYGARLRLTESQRDALRSAFNQKLAEVETTVSGRGGLGVTTAKRSNVEAELGMDRVTFTSLIASRESHALPVILRLQRVLGVELVTRDQLNAAYGSYVKHLEENYW